MTITLVLMSDIHGNMPALRAVAASLPEHDAVIVAGDLCLEGPAPDEVVDFLQEQGWTAVMGNSDRDVVEPDQAAKKHAARIAWTRERLGPERLNWLASLPFSTRFERDGSGSALVVHANPLDMDTHLQPTMTQDELRPYLETVDAEILAFGHLHTPYLRPVSGILLADVSSVGHPKDLDRRAAFTVVGWDRSRRTVHQVRVPYEIEETLHLLRASDMPDAEKQAQDLLRASY